MRKSSQQQKIPTYFQIPMGNIPGKRNKSKFNKETTRNDTQYQGENNHF